MSNGCDLLLDWKMGGVAHGAELRSWGAKAPPFTSGTILRVAPLVKGGALAPQEQSSAPCATPPIFSKVFNSMAMHAGNTIFAF